MKLNAYELSIPTPTDRQELVLQLWRSSSAPVLVLDTCQRLECFGFDRPSLPHARVCQSWDDAEAFGRLARIASGLESRILGELEILGQVRNAYKFFQKAYGQDMKKLDRVFQDAIALARKARRESGIDRNLTSLSGLASRELIKRVPEGEPIAVIGAGSIAGSAARYLGKRGKSPVRVSSRCPENALNLAMEVGGFGAGLDELTHLLRGVSGVLTATAAPHPVLYMHHLEHASASPAIIDLGVPSDCHEDVRSSDDIEYIGLEEIESKAEVNTEERRQCASVAARIIEEGAEAWSANY